MILRRVGNKSKMAMEIQKYFPQHKIYIEPFFGAGGMFFNKPKVQYNIVNDLDSDVFNLFQVVSNNKKELEEAFFTMPIHSDLLNYWKKNKEQNPIQKALRFLFLSNFTLYGKQDTVRYGCENSKDCFYKGLNETHKKIFDVQFANFSFEKFIRVTTQVLRNRGNINETLIYCDPPYLDTTDTYSNSFINSDSEKLFDCLIETGCKFAYSEFDHPFILEQAEKRGLNVIKIGERQNLNNRRIEILVTNYKKPLSLFDGV